MTTKPKTWCLRHLLTAAAAVAGLAMLFVILGKGASTIPPDFQFQSHFSRGQAELFYAKARQELRRNYWSGIYGNLTNLQFNYAWQRWRNGQGHIDGVLTNANADVMACVRFRNGESFWITVESAGYQGMAKSR